MIGERLHLDFETRSLAKFGKGGWGLYRYAECATTSVWCFSWRFGNSGPVSTWWRGEPLPPEVVEHVRSGGIVVAHNGPFERRIWNFILTRMMHGYLPGIAIEQVDCTMARCLAVGLPNDLERAARVVKAPHQKDTAGHDVMMKMAKPRNVKWRDLAFAEAYARGELRLVAITDTLERSTYGLLDQPVMQPDQVVLELDWNYDETLRAVQTAYCQTDVLAETGVDMAVPALSDREMAIWRFNERVNDRGFPIDVPLIGTIEGVIDAAGANANRRLWTITNGTVKKTTDYPKLKKWLETRNVVAYNKDGKTSVAKGVRDDLLIAAENDPEAKEAIEIFAAMAKLSYAGKIGKALEVRTHDNRIHGVFRYHTAPTGRFSATVWQAHNLERVDEESELPTLRELIKVLEKFGVEPGASVVELATGRTLHWMSKMSRPIIKARKGKIFRGVDLSNIEGRVNAWLAGEQWKLDAFAAFDRGEGPDLYKVTAGGILNVNPIVVTKLQRQTLGKVPDLAGGYQGGVMAYVTMGANLGVKVEDIADVAAATTDPAVWAATSKTYRARFSCGLEQSVWTGLKVVVNAWRKKHPAIVQSWWDRQDAAIEAVSVPGAITSCCGGKIRYLADHGFLWCMLPSGRTIGYPSPSIVRVPYIKEEKQEIDGVEVIVEIEAYKNAVQVWGLEKSHWTPYTLYGGIQCENDDQGFSRDIFMDGGVDIEAAGYNIVFHCHDEYLTEDDPTFGSSAHMKFLLSQPRSYAPGLPLAAAAWEDERYVK